MRAPADLLVLAAGLGTGGTERHLARLLPGLAARGLRCRVWNAGEVGAARDSLVEAGVPVEERALPVAARDLAGCARLYAALARRPAALVHSYLYGHHWLDALACRMAGLPYISSRRNLAHWRSGKTILRERWRTRWSAAVVANCRAAADMAVADGAAPARVLVIPNGVLPAAGTQGDLATREQARQEARRRLGVPQEALVIGSVASLKAVKDPLRLLDAFAACLGADTRAHLVFIGKGPLRGDLERRARAAGVEDRVHLVGRASEPQELLAGLDIFALASRSEASPNALAEAMAAGLAVVATQVGGVPELVEAGVSGLLVPPGDTEALAGALAALAPDGTWRRRLGTAAAARMRAQCSPEAEVEAHARLYAHLLGQDRTFRAA